MTAFGLMFHHFHDGARHPKGQGAISRDEFGALLDYYADRILNAHDWVNCLHDGSLSDNAVCLTFDDGLRCQFDIALPALEKRGLTAFWFPYTAPLADELDRLELYRYFRTVCFANIDEFYGSFEKTCRVSTYADDIAAGLACFDPQTYLAEYPFYSDSDRRFRFVRDRILGADRFFQIMDKMIEATGFDCAEASRTLWMGVEELKHLDQTGHVIGLHSHTHPTNLTALEASRQDWEFATNTTWLKQLLNITPDCVSYPCGAYDQRLIAMLNKHGIRTGFQSRMGPSNGAMTVPRLDHAIAVERLALGEASAENYK